MRKVAGKFLIPLVLMAWRWILEKCVWSNKSENSFYVTPPQEVEWVAEAH